MKRTILEGELGEEVKKQLDLITSYKKTIRTLSEDVNVSENKMWQYIRKEIPDISDSCYITEIDGQVLLVDRMKDEITKHP